MSPALKLERTDHRSVLSIDTNGDSVHAGIARAMGLLRDVVRDVGNTTGNVFNFIMQSDLGV